METYQKLFSTNEYTQINSKKIRHNFIEIPTTIFEININQDDNIDLSFTLRNKDGDEEYDCQRFAKFLLLNNRGRVIYSFTNKHKKFSDWITCFNDDKDTQKYQISKNINVTKGKYVCKYWVYACDDCFCKIEINSTNKINSIDNCQIKH